MIDKRGIVIIYQITDSWSTCVSFTMVFVGVKQRSNPNEEKKTKRFASIVFLLIHQQDHLAKY
jgi:hypothetical protein